MDIAEALTAKGYEIDRRKIVLKDAIKETGEFTASVKLHREVTLQIPITVSVEAAEGEPKPERKARKKADRDDTKGETSGGREANGDAAAESDKAQESDPA